MKIEVIDSLVEPDGSMVTVLFNDSDVIFPYSGDTHPEGFAYREKENVFVVELSAVWIDEGGKEVDLGATCTLTSGEEVVWCDLQIANYEMSDVAFVNLHGPTGQI